MPRSLLPRLLPWALVWAVALEPASATVSVYVSPEALEQSSTLILEATVRESASGLDPATERLATYVTLDVERVVRGPRGLSEVVLREPGGRFGDRVLDLDAVPQYAPGERVLVYLEPGPDGALRTSQMFFGKYLVLPDASGRETYAVRELDGRGRILSRPRPEEEWRRLQDLVDRGGRAGRASKPHAERPWLARPPELERVLWDTAERALLAEQSERPDARRFTPGTAGAADESLGPQFVPLQSATPARWVQSDSGTPVLIHVEPARDPLANPALAVAQVQSAMDAWNAVSEARITVVPGNLAYDYTGTHAASPASLYSNVNVVLFGDPYDDISDPIGCAGVLALGGYWRTSSITSTVNAHSFYSAMQLYVIFNDGFECFLGDPENLAEVATHEIGHGLGFGHSTAPDSVMRSVAYGRRGARLGDDDRDAAHCHYPHVFGIVSPAGGASWTAGTTHSIVWTASVESGSDPGTVTLEYSTDAGATWIPLAADVPNVGTYSWTVPSVSSQSALVRLVRRHRGDHVPAEYPEACSQAVSPATFTIAPPTAAPGVVPDGSNGPPLRLAKTATGLLHLTWGSAVSGAPDDYAIYAGSLAALRGGISDASPVTCSAGVDLAQDVQVQGNVYFLVAALAGALEGPLGSTSSGAERPAPEPSCGSSATNGDRASFPVNPLRASGPPVRGTARGARLARSWTP